MTCVKHIFQQHIVLQFNVTNTLSDQFLADVAVEVQMDDTDLWEVETTVRCAELPYNLPGVTYICLRTTHDSDDPLPVVDFTMDAQLIFFVKEVEAGGDVDMDDPGYEDEYPLEAIEVSASDFIAAVALPSFRATWESAGNENEVCLRRRSFHFTSECRVAFALCASSPSVPNAP